MPIHARPPRSARVLLALIGASAWLTALAACQPVRVAVRSPAAPPAPAVTPATPAAARSCAAPDPAGPTLPFAGGAMVPICRDVHADPATTAAERALLVTHLGWAQHRLVETLGPQQAAPPVVIFCKTD